MLKNLSKARRKLPMQSAISKGKASGKSKNKTQELVTLRQTAKSIRSSLHSFCRIRLHPQFDS